jgi:hypothetical protein
MVARARRCRQCVTLLQLVRLWRTYSLTRRRHRHTAKYVSSYCCTCVLILLYMFSHATINLSSYYYMGVLKLLYMCPQTTTYSATLWRQRCPDAYLSECVSYVLKSALRHWRTQAATHHMYLYIHTHTHIYISYICIIYTYRIYIYIYVYIYISLQTYMAAAQVNILCAIRRCYADVCC